MQVYLTLHASWSHDVFEWPWDCRRMHFVHLHFCRLLPSCSTCVTLRDISDHLAKLGAEYDSALEYRELTVSGSGGTTVAAATRLDVGRKGKKSATFTYDDDSKTKIGKHALLLAITVRSKSLQRILGISFRRQRFATSSAFCKSSSVRERTANSKLCLLLIAVVLFCCCPISRA